jgi:16S rRNA (uracil1498-N3)-methyltransferase
MITLLVTPADLQHEQLRVEGESYRHLFRARRAAVGDALRLVDGAGRARFGSIAAVERSAGHILLGEPAPANEPPLYLELFCPLPKPERTAWLVEKVTEVGVSSIRFLRSERAPRELTAGGLARLGRVAAAAVEQCHRARVPELSGPHDWEELASLLAESDERYVLDPRAAQRSPAESSAARTALVVGPEGGWAEAEQASLARSGCRPLRLGARVLRIETAAVVGAGLLLAGCD